MKALSNLPRRALVIAALGAALLPWQAGAQTQWPSKPIKLVIPFAPGGSNDNIGRVLASKLAPRLGQPVVVENKGGGGGTIGTDFVAKSAPDGYTLLFVSGSIATNAASGKKLPYDPVKDLQPIAKVGAGPFAIVVGNKVKANTLQDFIAMAKAKPGSIDYGSAGVGGINHLGTELFASAAKVKLVHVPYKGIGPAFQDIMGGNLQMVLPTLASVMPHVRAGSMKALAVTSPERSALAPDIPTVAEAGVPGFELEVWWGVMGPAGMPPEVTKRLNQEINAVIGQPEMKELLAREGATAQPGTPEALGKSVVSDIDRWSRLIKEAHIEVQ